MSENKTSDKQEILSPRVRQLLIDLYEARMWGSKEVTNERRDEIVELLGLEAWSCLNEAQNKIPCAGWCGTEQRCPAAFKAVPSARGISAELLEIIRHNESIDDNGDPVGGKPETSWELGYAAGIRCLYRFLSKAANSSYVGEKS